MAEITDVQRVAINKLVPYENNAKIHNEDQLQKIAKSIEEFGFISPVLIDKDFNIIAGHGRTEAAKIAGLTELPCVFIEGLTEDQRKAYIIADNRLSEFGAWDENLVNLEIESLTGLDFDMSDLDFEPPAVDDDEGYYGDERERTNNAYNLDIAHSVISTNNFWQMPIIENDDYIPDRLIGFNYAKTSKDKKCGIHFFLDDYQFERLWSNPEGYIEILKDYECILSPDFSLYMDMPMPMKIWNIYRSRLIGSYYQSCGLKVIPTISWGEPETYKFCFLGIPKKSIVAISTIGVKENSNALEIWTDGMNAMIRSIKPSAIIVYGGALDFDYGNIKVVYFENEVLERWN